MDQSLHVIGTAGHVDHGKSTLVKALTGIDPDRLAEEKAREMTIDLGFAWLTLGDQEIGIVDVPGHRDFIENMLAGVGSIDLALFVVAADEGVMPQTREHLAILDLLQIDQGIVALTKTDLIDDDDWLELVMLDISEALEGSVLADAPIVPVSAFTGEGLDDLKSLLEQRLAIIGPKPDDSRPRLPVDRVFTLAGFGTVVTGTLTGGSLKIGDQLEIVPGRRKVRVRGLQTHKKKLEAAYPGSRVAINLTNVDRDEVQRGQVVAAEGVVNDTLMVDALYRHLPDADEPLKHNRQIKLFVGSAEVSARTRIIGSKTIEPGDEGWLQLALSEPVAVAAGDRFILRRPSPPATLGGGHILDPHPGRRHRRFRPEVAERFRTLIDGTPEDLIRLALERQQPATKQQLIDRSGLDSTLAAGTIEQMLQNQSLHKIGRSYLLESYWQKSKSRLLQQLTTYHENNPLRLGMPREELRSKLGHPPAIYNALVDECVTAGTVVDEGPVLRSADHTLTFSPSQEQQIQALVNTMHRAGASTPSVKEVQQSIGTDLYYALIDLGKLRQIDSDVVYEQEQFSELSAKVIEYLDQNGEIDAAQTRDLLHTSRKYAIALLEYLDDSRVTKRVGDVRVRA